MQITPGMLQTLETIGHQLGNYRDRKLAEASSPEGPLRNWKPACSNGQSKLAGALEAALDSEMRFRAMFERRRLSALRCSARPGRSSSGTDARADARL